MTACVRWSAVALAALALSACNSVEPLAPVRASASFQTLPPEELIGKWGVASYRADKDRARTERMARVQCRNPYVIAKGPTDGVMMHVADDPELHELALKRANDGKTYLGFASPPGDPQDREILSMTHDTVVMRFVDADTNARYGTFIYTRCK
jgi:hypothetical protein